MGDTTKAKVRQKKGTIVCNRRGQKSRVLGTCTGLKCLDEETLERVGSISLKVERIINSRFFQS